MDYDWQQESSLREQIRMAILESKTFDKTQRKGMLQFLEHVLEERKSTKSELKSVRSKVERILNTLAFIEPSVKRNKALNALVTGLQDEFGSIFKSAEEGE